FCFQGLWKWTNVLVASITSRCSGNEPALLPKRAPNVLAESQTGYLLLRTDILQKTVNKGNWRIGGELIYVVWLSPSFSKRPSIYTDSTIEQMRPYSAALSEGNRIHEARSVEKP
ncbi:unnamed protein product, partial [Porites evermanni]